MNASLKPKSAVVRQFNIHKDSFGSWGYEYSASCIVRGAVFIVNFDREVGKIVDILIDDSLLECLSVLVERQRILIVSLINAGRASCLSNLRNYLKFDRVCRVDRR